jgi:hypothetical protein
MEIIALVVAVLVQVASQTFEQIRQVVEVVTAALAV